MISQTAEYALRASVYLAEHEGVFINRRDLAKAIHVPNDYLTKVLQDLVQAGILRAQRGPGGGYRLNKGPHETSVYEVITAVSMVFRVKACPLGRPDHARLCPLHRRLDDAAAYIENAFRVTTLDELLDSDPNTAGCHFPNGA